MADKIKALYAKYGDILRYLIIGGITTLIDVGMFALLGGALGLHYVPAKLICWVLAVAFAFVGNKWIVFRSETRDRRDLFREAGSFLLMRLISLAFNYGFLYLTIDVFGWGENLSNLLGNGFVIIVNYVLSKLVVFRKRAE